MTTDCVPCGGAGRYPVYRGEPSQGHDLEPCELCASPPRLDDRPGGRRVTTPTAAYDDALSAWGRACAATLAAGDALSAATLLYKDAAGRHGSAQALEQTLRRELHRLAGLAGPPAPEDDARVPCRVCNSHPCSCPPRAKRRPRGREASAAVPPPAAPAAPEAVAATGVSVQQQTPAAAGGGAAGATEPGLLFADEARRPTAHEGGL